VYCIKNLYYQIVKPPFGSLKGAAGGAAVVCVLVLLVSVFQPALRPAAYALALSILALLLTSLFVVESRICARLNDLSFATTLYHNLQRGKVPKDFFMEGAAATPSLELFLFKCLQLCSPDRVLELGSGQSTKLLCRYRQENPRHYILTLEEDLNWKNLLAEELSKTGTLHDYRHAPLESKSIVCPGTGVRIDTKWYSQVPDLSEKTFQLVLVDGPSTGAYSERFSRAGILQYIPAILDDWFIVVFDDAERYGERMTLREFERILKACNRKYVSFSVYGVKTQTVFCSPNLRFLASS
jgi:hypothetical protein